MEDNLESITKHWSELEYPDAKQRRDAEARLLRRRGWLVQIETKDVGGFKTYSIFGAKEFKF
jgi:hypothetical protein